MINKGSKKRILCIGNQKGSGICPACFQSLCITVDLVVQFLNSSFHTDTIGFAHWQAIDHFGNSAKSNAGLSGHILHGRNGIFFFHKNLLCKFIGIFVKMNVVFRDVIIMDNFMFVKRIYEKVCETLHESIKS